MDEATLALIRKGAAIPDDREVIRLLRLHGILSMAIWVIGFEEETDADHWRGCPTIPTRSTSPRTGGRPTFASQPPPVGSLRPTQRKWDYKHQVLQTCHMPPWHTLVWFKLPRWCYSAGRNRCAHVSTS
jgi:anaerobic magnesium-protoporphyrin IX monomethyl ester cyclase